MKYLSLCSGIEAATVAWESLGWEPTAFAEFDQFPSAVLAHHYPDVPNLGDISKIDGKKYKETDIVVGGTPCQSFSVAGLREGLDDERGNLAFEFCRLVREVQPLWFVWENVPGVLSSNEGRDFGSILGAMGDIGYGVCWRVLDAQFFGVAQRRRRIFVVGYLGDWRPAAAVLFEPESLRGDPTASREKGKEVTGTLGSRSTAGGGLGTDFECAGGLQPGEGKVFPEIAQTVTAREHKEVTCGGFGITGNPVVLPIQDQATRHGGKDDRGKGNGLGVGEEGDPAHTLTGGDRHAICIQGSMIGRKEENGPQGEGVNEEISFTQNATDRHAVVYENHPMDSRIKETDQSPSCAARWGTGGNNLPLVQAAAHLNHMTVRRLTPIECERLQGFPDDYTKIPYRGKPAEKCPDGPRYKACGNSMAVPVMRWIGERIDLFTNK